MPEVVEVIWLTPRLVRIVLGGDELAGFAAGQYTDHYVKLQVPPPGAGYEAPFDLEAIRATRPPEEWPRTRTYTVRAWDPEQLRLTIDFVVHGDDGVAGPWAARAKPGDRLGLRGPGGAYPDPTADWYLMLGDPSVIPAIAASLERVPPGRPVLAVIQVDQPDDEVPLHTAGDLELVWIRGGGEDAVVDELRRRTWREGRVDAFAHGEASAVRSIRRFLLAEIGLPREHVSISGYWKRARAEEGWREDKAEWNRLVEADLQT